MLQRLTGALLACSLLPGSLPAQVLARPGWAGSGVAPEAWWLRAVFYRIDPLTFQDSDGDSKGDLQGIVDRLDYIQSLGVDAILLEQPAAAPGDLGDLIREASRRQLRVLVRLPAGPARPTRAELLGTVQGWLSNGAAGVWAPGAGYGVAGAEYADLLTALRGLLQSFPGERVLLTDPAPVTLGLAPRPVRLNRRINPGSFNAARGGVLTTTALFSQATDAVAALRTGLLAASQEPSPGLNPLLRAEPAPPTASPDAFGDAALLLASRGAMILNAGQEIGLNLDPDPKPGTQPASTPASTVTSTTVMQWTPSNRTPSPSEAESPKAPVAPGSATEFGAYHPYVPPPRGLPGQGPSPVRVTLDTNAPAALPDPDTLPGFTTGSLPAPPLDGATRNVISQDRDPHSLLNAYRQLIAIHHGNPTLRNGTQYVLESETPGTLLWVRRAPAGARTAANVLTAVNLTAAPVTLDLDARLEAGSMRGGALRPLFTSSLAGQTGETTSHLALPAHGVLVGEIFHAGSLRTNEAHEVARPRHSGRRGRRVRR